MGVFDPEIATYDPDLFHVQRASVVGNTLGEFTLGYSTLGETTYTEWGEVPAATFNFTAEYNPDEFGTLIIGSETASIAIAMEDTPSAPPLQVLEKVKVVYDEDVIFLGTVDGIEITKRPTDRYQDRYTFVATLVGTYAAAMGKEFCFGDLPKESPLNRIKRFYNVVGA